MEAWKKVRGNKDKDFRDCCPAGRLERFATFYDRAFRFQALTLFEKIEGHHYFKDETTDMANVLH